MKRLSCLSLCIALASCSTSNQISIERNSTPLPVKWAPAVQAEETKALTLTQQLDDELLTLVQSALTNNPSLQQTRHELQASQYRAEASGASLWPSLDLTVRNSVSQTTSADETDTSAELGLSLKYEVDIWGKLSASDQQQNLNLLKQQAAYYESVNILIADVVLNFYAIVEAEQQLSLNVKRLENTKKNLTIIEMGYEQGLNDALDVYLTRNDLANEEANIAAQRQTLTSLKRQLKQLTGQYPDHHLTLNQKAIELLPLPDLTQISTDVVKHQPKLQAAWHGVMASNAALAFAHKQRFPSLSLTLNAGDSGDDIGAIISDFDLGWSLIGNLTQPLFNAGRLKANENAAEANLRAVEQNYVAVFLQSFESIERLLANQSSLSQQLEARTIAQNNAVAAEQLSFEQYQNGLVNYATVLAAQSRSYAAQSTVIRLKYQLLENQTNLFTALGGDFNIVTTQDDKAL